MKHLFIPFLFILLLSSCVGEDLVYPESFETEETDTTDTEGDTSTVSRTSREGTFDNSFSSHYTTIGSVELITNTDGSLSIEFQDDAEIGSGPSLYLILSNTTSTPFSIDKSGNSRIVNATSAQVTYNKLESGFKGSKTFDVPDGVAIEDYKYVVWYCTFGPVFGYAELN